MQQLILPSEEIYPYQFEVNKIDFEQWRRLAWIDYDFMKVPPIPVYEIPEEFRMNSWKYMLPDGNHRWLYGHVTAGRVSAILLLPKEEIKIEEWGMAPFRHANNPKIYERTLGIYKLQENIWSI
jgi:hypothetical protein